MVAPATVSLASECETIRSECVKGSEEETDDENKKNTTKSGMTKHERKRKGNEASSEEETDHENINNIRKNGEEKVRERRGGGRGINETSGGKKKTDDRGK